MPSMMQQQMVIIKARLGDDVRKIPVHNTDFTVDELLVMMQRIFKGRLNPSDQVTLKYRDEDRDLVTIGDDSDLAFAIQTNPILNVVLFVNGVPLPLENDQVKQIRNQLKEIRDTANQLLDVIEPTDGQRTSPNGQHLNLNGNADQPSPPEVKKEPSVASDRSNPAIAQSQSHEFDPLVKTNQMSGGGVPTSMGDQQQQPPPSSLPSTPGYRGGVPPEPHGGGGGGHNEGTFRPETPNSQSSRCDGSVVTNDSAPPAVPQENVATIQPTMHQQINAGQPPQQMLVNGPPIVSATNPLPPQVPPPASQAFGAQQQPTAPHPTSHPAYPPVFEGYASQPQQQQQAPPTSHPGAGAPPVAPPQQQSFHPPAPTGTTPTSYAQQAQYQQQPPYGMQQQQAPPSQFQQQQQQNAPPFAPYGGMSTTGQQQQHPPAPPAVSSMAPSVGAPPRMSTGQIPPPPQQPGPPPSMPMAAPGVNPFARGPMAANPYIRPAFQQPQTPNAYQYPQQQ